ncbi:MAG: hypothetical protein KF846_07880 [Cyclobacteriaceae bacterium]|nr:hypothetical protein [Cyclobacteriaceae bacterium]
MKLNITISFVASGTIRWVTKIAYLLSVEGHDCVTARVELVSVEFSERIAR